MPNVESLRTRRGTCYTQITADYVADELCLVKKHGSTGSQLGFAHNIRFKCLYGPFELHDENIAKENTLMISLTGERNVVLNAAKRSVLQEVRRSKCQWFKPQSIRKTKLKPKLQLLITF